MFAERSLKKELLDADHIPTEDLRRNLYELNIINKYLGGHAATLKGIKEFTPKNGSSLSIVDIGSGGGDTLKVIAKWGRAQGIKMELTGVDLKADCIAYAREQCRDYPEITFIQSDYRDLIKSGKKFELAVACLFCHHLSEEEIQELLNWCAANCSAGFIINDLHRHPLAWYSIKWLTSLFSASRLVKNDAPLSVLRGFKRKELLRLIPASLERMLDLRWCWAFRWLMLVKKDLA